MALLVIARVYLFARGLVYLPKQSTASPNVIDNLASDTITSLFLVHHVPLRLPVYHSIAFAC